MKFTFIPINVRGGNKKPFIYLYIVRWMDLTIFIGGQIAWLNAMRILEINSNQVKIQFYDDYINSAIWFRFFLHFKIFDSINLLSSAFKQRRELIHTHTHSKAESRQIHYEAYSKRLKLQRLFDLSIYFQFPDVIFFVVERMNNFMTHIQLSGGFIVTATTICYWCCCCCCYFLFSHQGKKANYKHNLMLS